MKGILLRLLAAGGCVLALALASFAAPAARGPGEGEILVLTVRGPITPSVAEYIERGFTEARAAATALVVIELDTPGGLDKSMRSISQQILNSPVPVVVYVSPSGGRAASAGTFITLAADVAAMAPGTTIGAAHPVSLVGGQGEDKTMEEKVVNDSAAYIRSLAESRGRNGDWAEKAVRDSVSITDTAALEEKVVDLIAPDLETLLGRIDGRTVTRSTGEATITTAGRTVSRLPMDLRRRILDTLSDPNIAYLLLMLGALGIFFELYHPGSFYPGIIGAIAIILALYSLQTLPVNYAGLLLILLALALYFAETQVTSFGLLAIGGTVSLLMGSLMLVRSPAPWLRISLAVILPVVGLTALFFLVVLQRIAVSYRRKPTTGLEGIVGETGEAMEDLSPRGRVFVRGEIWNAQCPGGASRGDTVVVTAARDLMLTVSKEPKEVER